MKKITSFVATLALTMVVTAGTAFAADTVNPSDVENLKGTALNASASLTWDAATDDTGVAGYQVHYGLSSVSQPGQKYDNVKDVKNVTSFTVTDLLNSKPYYFSVVAYDAAGNESGKWAKELTLTPSSAAGSDTEAPTVSKAEALNMEEVKITFSEAVVLPEEDPEEAFTIEDDETFVLLAVLDAEVDKEDDTGKTVILTTKKQTTGAKYTVTVGIDVEDKAGNTIVSGTSDSGAFVGSDKEKQSDTEGPQMVSVSVTDATHIVVNFNEPVVLGIDPAKNFNVSEKSDATKTISVSEVALGKNTAGVDKAAVMLKVAALADGVDYVVTAVDLKDEAGNTVAASKSSMEFKKGTAPSTGEDTTPPKDVDNFVAKAVMKAQKYMVSLSWDNKDNSDTKTQTVYLSKDKGVSYGKKVDLDSLAEKYEAGEYEPGEYWFKLTQRDVAGNESEGKVAKLTLSETGPGLVGLAIASLGLGRRFGRKKRM